MVCLGNICRSPLAEGLLQKHLSDNGIKAIVDSAGTGNWHSGESPDHRSVKVAASNGLDISKQRARQIRLDDFDEFDLIFTMDDSVQRDVRKLVTNNDHLNKIHLLRIFAGHTESLVPDPYYEGKEAFEHVYDLLDHSCELAASRIIESYGNNKKP